MSPPSLATIAVLGLTLRVGAAPNERELLDLVRDAHRSTRDAIRTCTCRVAFAGTRSGPKGALTPREQSCSVKYWYRDGVVRALASEDGNEIDSLWEDSTEKVLVTGQHAGKPHQTATLRRRHGKEMGVCDPWVRALLVLNVPGSIDYVPFEELLTKATRVRKVERRKTEGTEVVVVNLFFDRSNDQPTPSTWDVAIHFDPALNYLVRKTLYVGSIKKITYRREDEIVRFKTCEPGVFFPEKGAGRSGPDGKTDLEYTAEFTEIQVDQPVPDEVFGFQFPNGIILRDKIRGTKYPVDAQGNQIGPAEEIPSHRVPPPPVDGLSVSEGARTETQDEPHSRSRWILPGSLGILLLAGLGWSLRLWRSRTTEAK